MKERSPARFGAVVALVVVVVVAAGAAYIWLARDDVAAIDPALLHAADGGDPVAVSQVWWAAYWSGRTDLLQRYTDPAIESADTLTVLVGHSAFHAALNPGPPPLEAGDCQRAVGFDEVRLLCDVVIVGVSDGYRWDPGRRQSYVTVVDSGRVTAVSFDGFHLDGVGEIPRIVRHAESVDRSGFKEACQGDPGRYEVYDEPVEFFALQDDIVDFPDFVVNGECGAFLREVLDG
jgi:hypothetical protein